MTNKRFRIEKSGGLYQIYDNGELIPILDGQPIVDLLNDLSDENEQLKKENNMLKTTIGRNEAYINRLKHKGEWK